ncbi:hypothetical protein GBA52_014163 [Prunus armeniaca]|nr:hypothetical protein GBA52_014163 [Prunus armeniaca]
MTATAAIMAGLAAVSGAGAPILALKLSSSLLYMAVTGILLVMNKIQPSQLAEEQRNASRHFKRLREEIRTTLALNTLTLKIVFSAYKVVANKHTWKSMDEQKWDFRVRESINFRHGYKQQFQQSVSTRYGESETPMALISSAQVFPFGADMESEDEEGGEDDD